jgi:hypothetical protein
MTIPTEIKNWFDLQSKNFTASAKIVSREEVGQDYFFRLDNKMPDKLIPRMPVSAMPREDITTPRICVGKSLMGCISSIGRTADDFLYLSYVDEKYDGGYELSIIKFDWAVKVKSKLVPDVDKTNEHWLCAMTPNQKEYKPKVVGKFFIHQMLLTPTGSKPVDEMTNFKHRAVKAYLEVNEDVQVNINETNKVGAGFYKLEYSDYDYIRVNKDKFQMSHDCPVSVSAVEKSEYYKVKKLAAANLNFVTPNSLKW